MLPIFMTHAVGLNMFCTMQVRWRLFRESCCPYEGNYVKDLMALGRPLATTIIVDNRRDSSVRGIPGGHLTERRPARVGQGVGRLISTFGVLQKRGAADTPLFVCRAARTHMCSSRRMRCQSAPSSTRRTTLSCWTSCPSSWSCRTYATTFHITKCLFSVQVSSVRPSSRSDCLKLLCFLKWTRL